MNRLLIRSIAPAAAASLSYYMINRNEGQKVTHDSPFSIAHCEGTTVGASASLETRSNWSGTHSTMVHVHYPESVEEIEDLVAQAHSNSSKLRPLGSALSPNALGFADAHSTNVSLSLLDKVVAVDPSQNLVTVQSGCRVSSLLDALRPYNMTLPNLASIAEQQVGGFISVGAHGSGATIPSVDDFVESFKIVTPAFGTLTLSRSDSGMNRRIFDLCRVGLGLFGVIVEVTLRTVPSHYLLEKTFVLTREEAVSRLPELVRGHKHMRYMWIPYEDAVVVVCNDPCDGKDLPSPMHKVANFKDRLEPFVDLLMSHPENKITAEEARDFGMGELRDALLALGPLDSSWIKRVNAAEHKFWKNNSGYQHLPSDKLLQFDCGGSQWVQENCFPTGRQFEEDGSDMTFMIDLLRRIEEEDIPAPAPIEQRWSACSSSDMSACGSGNGKFSRDTLFSWVGIIMYLPSDHEEQRKKITEKFQTTYRDLFEELGRGVGAVTHWAKQEIPREEEKLEQTRENLRRRFPIDDFNAVKQLLDPRGVCSNEWYEKLFQ